MTSFILSARLMRATGAVKKCSTRVAGATLLIAVAACGGGGGGDSGGSCSPSPAISSSPVTAATVGVQYAYWTQSRIACIPLLSACSGVELTQGPTGAGVDPIRQLVYWTPSPEDAGRSIAFAIVTRADLCGKRASQSWTVTVAPVSSIHSFQASQLFVPPGESVTVTGIFDGSGTIQGVGPVTSGVPVTIGAINTETTVTLNVQGPAGDFWTQSITIRLLAPPLITTFRAEPASIGINAASTLWWWVDGPVDSVRIEPLGATVASNSAWTVYPTTTTTYVLTATNRAGSVTASVEVVVLPPSSITEFSASASSTTLGGTVTLTARFAGMGEILKENERGGMDHLATLNSGESVSSGPLDRNTRFTLRVTGGTTVTQDLTVALTGPGTFESVSQTDFAVLDAVLLGDGRVFMASQRRAYYYNPATKQLSAGAALNRPTVYLTLLADGRVMMVSPFVDIGASSAQIYDPTNDWYGSVGNLGIVPGIPVQAMTLGDGRVLVRSDADARHVGQTAGISLYGTTSFGPLIGPPSLAGTRGVPLADGRVLFIRAISGSQIFTPGADTFSPSSAAFMQRFSGYTRVLLQDGRVFIHGGASVVGEIYDPATDAVSLADPYIYPNLNGQAAVLLATGKVLLTGGSGYATSILFDPATRSFTRTGGLQTPRSSAVAVRLRDDRVLVLGGCGSTPCPIEIYTP